MKHSNSSLGFIISFMCCIFLVSCHNDEDLFPLSETIEDVRQDEFTLSNSQDPFISNEEIHARLADADTYEIETLDDLNIPMQKANIVFKEALAKDLFEHQIPATLMVSRASVARHTEYEVQPLVMPEDIHQKMFFKSKFSATVVNLINAVVMSEYRISTGTTYCCYWDVFYHSVLLDSNQKFGYVDSPLCALHPETRNAFLERGYAMEKKEQVGGKTKIELYSFQLRILYKDTNNKTIYLGILYPRAIDSSPWKGYEFSYNILSL